VDFKEEE
jgi:hypothetical protein